MKKGTFIKLVISIAFCFAAAIVGSFVTTPAVTGWYKTIIKPSFSPPNWLFGPVWSALYLSMAIAFWKVWISKKKDKYTGMRYFYIQLALNVFWSVLFFGLRAPRLALLDIIVLWIMISVTMRSFFKVSKVSGWLLVPYLIWVSFATILNAAIATLN